MIIHVRKRITSPARSQDRLAGTYPMIRVRQCVFIGAPSEGATRPLEGPEAARPMKVRMTRFDMNIRSVPRLVTLKLAAAAALIVVAAFLGSMLSTHDAVAQATRSVEWARFDVTIDVRPNGTFHVTEAQTVDFRGGPFRTG